MPGWAVLSFTMTTISLYQYFNIKKFTDAHDQQKSNKDFEKDQEIEIRKDEIELEIKQTTLEKILQENRKLELEDLL